MKERLFALTLLVLKRCDGILWDLIGHSVGWDNICTVAMWRGVLARVTSLISLNLAFADKNGYCLS